MQFKSIFVSFVTLSVAIAAKSLPRIDKDKAALLIIDHQTGLFNLVRDREPVHYRNAVLAHAALGPLFNLTTVITTSAETGPNGPLPKEIPQMHPNAPIIRRQGEVNAWDDPLFRAAVKATGKKQFIIAGITTDVCTAFVALSLLSEGYEVFANADASGTFDEETARLANDRMRQAGAQVVTIFAIVGDLMRDWRNTPGTADVLPYLDQYMPSIGMIARSHAFSVLNGTIEQVHEDLITV
ncbi:Isochorismatase hydrolase [Ascobolus immersus RN42]|uniref:Isochorismatase hydrolase n=1 Tax=Ascobolus immersus RN42 TaxID=1160509 RepID=A0A3N4HY05_ASCIM|nr:Isochorismatase hydrolase [Ascobolus immersus RN42]